MIIQLENSESRQRSLQTITESILKACYPEKIILFGSAAWGKPGPDSDLDLLIVIETENTRKMARHIDMALFPRELAIDVMVVTPQQVSHRLAQNDFFFKEIFQKGKILYDRARQ